MRNPASFCHKSKCLTKPTFSYIIMVISLREFAFTLKDATLIEELESTDNIMIPKRSFISLKHGIMTPKSVDLSLLTE